MSTILLTGSCGFIARHVIDLLHAQGHRVIGVDSLDPRVHKDGIPRWWGSEPLALCRYEQTPQSFIDDADVVIHLAAQVSVADSATDPVRYIEQNTLDTAVFLRRLRDKPLVVASSMSVYGEGGVRVKETHPVCPASVYGLTKYDQERLCLIWGQQTKVPVTALRFFNIYGPGQSLHNSYTGVLANFANALLGDMRPTVFEDGKQTRDFIHVHDVANAVVRAAFAGRTGVFNVCTGQATTVLSAARLLAESLGKEIQPEVTGTMRPGDIRHCTGDPSQARVELDFLSKVSFSQGIKEYGQSLSR